MLAAVMGVGAFLMHGCSLPSSPPQLGAGPCVGGGDGNIGGFRVNVQNVRWANSVTRPGYEQMSKKQLSLMGVDTEEKPASSFLVVDLQITNATNAPIAWNLLGHSVMNYKVISPEGTQYEFRQDLSNISISTGGGMQNLNPGTPVSGTIVFDVPMKNYTFAILQQRNTGFGRYVEQPVFQCLVQT